MIGHHNIFINGTIREMVGKGFPAMSGNNPIRIQMHFLMGDLTEPGVPVITFNGNKIISRPGIIPFAHSLQFTLLISHPSPIFPHQNYVPAVQPARWYFEV